MAGLFAPGTLKGPGVLALAAAGHIALITNAKPQILLALWEMATLNPILGSGPNNRIHNGSLI